MGFGRRFEGMASFNRFPWMAHGQISDETLMKQDVLRFFRVKQYISLQIETGAPTTNKANSFWARY
jgi:hypothetical protein